MTGGLRDEPWKVEEFARRNVWGKSVISPQTHISNLLTPLVVAPLARS